MTCATIMTPNPVTVSESDSIGRGADLIISHGYINLPVVNGEGRLVGLFGIYDLLALLVPRIAMVGDLIPNLRFLSDDMDELRGKYLSLRASPVQLAMNREPVTVQPETAVIEAVRLFCRNHMTIPVVDRGTGQLRGIISYWDAARAIAGTGR